VHDLVIMTIDRAADVDWCGCAIPISPVTDWCAFRVKCNKHIPAVASALTLPDSGHATATALAIGPGDWLMTAAAAERDALASRIAAVPRAYGVDVSDALVMLDLGAAAILMTRLTGIDSAQFGNGRVARTRFAGIPVILTTTGDTGIRMMFDISYARHMRSFLEFAT
jgi:heterotetrameric sarcosine oxidase gamma subunit